tara:strand:- start:39789 stop:40445 length:657 start_codon:yes stop_codon:yes gene_type:complete
MKVVSVILARGGSKEIPGKNIIKLCDRSLISYAIQASLDSASEETWVSTDCPRIKSEAISCGANVLDRPSNISGDNSKSESALLHFVQNVDCDVVVFIQPTSPMINSDHINSGISLIGKYDSVISVYKEHWVPSWRYIGVVPHPIGWDPASRPMRQDMDPIYIENGAFYITTSHLVTRNELRASGSIGFLEMSRADSIQIDSYSDLALAEKILSTKYE